MARDRRQPRSSSCSSSRSRSGRSHPRVRRCSRGRSRSTRGRSRSRGCSRSRGRGVSTSRSASRSPARQASAVVEVSVASAGVPSQVDAIPRQDTGPVITRAAAFRVKYRQHESVRLPISQVGFHPANRDGQPPSSARCVSLLGEILDIGFDVGEANAGGVVVEAVTTQAKLSLASWWIWGPKLVRLLLICAASTINSWIRRCAKCGHPHSHSST